MELGKEQIEIIINTIRPSDIITHIDNHLLEYQEFVNNEYKNGALSKAEFEYELNIIKKLKNKGGE